MKKRMTLMLLVVGLLCVFVIACSKDDNNPKQNNNEIESNVQEENQVEEAATTPEETNNEPDDLVKAAQAEGKVVVYSISSRMGNAAELFEKKYGIKVEAYNLKDFELIEKISQESRSGIRNADLVLAQESGRVLGELIEPGYLVNYVPESMKDIIPEQYQNPLVFSLITKVFSYNSETFHSPPVHNIWQLTEPEWKEKFFFKDPFQEGVNSSFLTMLTSPEIAQQIEDAYVRYFDKELVLTTENAGYEWIKAFFDNGAVLFNSDTTINEAVGVKGNNVDAVGLYVYSKLRERDTKDLAVLPIMSMDPFAGFYYPSLLLTVKDAQHPNAAKLFIEFLLTEEGFAPWNDGIGTYSSNPNILPSPGDNSFKTWSELLVGEDPDFTFYNRSNVEDFLNGFIYK